MAKYGDQNGKERTNAKRSPVGDGYSADFRGYLNLNLSAADKALFDDWWETSEPFNVLEAAVADGINLALKLEPRGGGFLASATQRRASSPNAGICVTARGASPSLAWGRLLFILYTLSAKDRWEDTQPLADPDRW